MKAEPGNPISVWPPVHDRSDDGNARERIVEGSKLRNVVFFAMVTAAIIFRIMNWPIKHEFRDVDELGYSWGSLELLEGNLPGIHYAPAGPQTWVGWVYEGLLAMEHLALPDSAEQKAPLTIRPFLAIDHCLFDAYRDTGPLRQVWVFTSFICSMAGVIAGFRLGQAKAGVPGAVFVGGTMALLPLFVEFSVQARPYIAAWSMGMVALYYALASSRRNALAISAIFMGLAIGSRIDMAMLLPFVWIEFWRVGNQREWLGRIFRYHAVLFIAFLVIAPWYLMTFAASLRALGSIRVSTAGLPVARPITVFFQLIWQQGMILHAALFVFAVLLWLLRERRWILALYLSLAAISMFKGAAFGLRYQGAPLLLTILAAASGIGFLQQRFEGACLALSVAALVLPAWGTMRLVAGSGRHFVPDSATQWVEQHVPAGTIVYTQPWLENLLPTAKSADAAWTEVTDTAAYQRKFEFAMKRRGLSANEIPRALSEANLALERSYRRFLFILGGRQWVEEPRYDIRLFETGPVFSVQNLPESFEQTGGVVILRSSSEDPIASTLGAPKVSWLGRWGEGTRIYCSPDVAGKLK